jgi:hypothetical protein
METKIDRSFPCLVLLPKRNSEQGYELPKTLGSDYVFFSPSIGLKHDPQYAPSQNEEKQSGALPKGRTNFFQSVEGSRSSLRVSATASRVSACESS